MRVIGGKFGGQRLVSFKAEHIRPTTDRVKETLFNKLENRFGLDLANIHVLDLFCGTGSLGIEALSRGARFCTFVDESTKSLKVLKENLEKLGISKKNYAVQKEDVLKFLHPRQDLRSGLVFIDPPFTEQMADLVLVHLSQCSVLLSDGLAAIESGTKEILKDHYLDLVRVDTKSYGDKALNFYRRQGVA